MFCLEKGAGRRLAAVRGGHYAPAPAGRPHGPRRCGGPEHHGVFLGIEPADYPRAGFVLACTLAQEFMKINHFLTKARESLGLR